MDRGIKVDIAACETSSTPSNVTVTRGVHRGQSDLAFDDDEWHAKIKATLIKEKSCWQVEGIRRFRTVGTKARARPLLVVALCIEEELD